MTRQRMLTIASIAAGLALAGGTALAGDAASPTGAFTGCLAVQTGMLTQVKRGDAPLSRCRKGQVVARLSVGDTAFRAGTGGGLVAERTAGTMTLSLRRDCANGQVVKWSGGAWACSPDADSPTTAGAGLELAGNALSIQPAYRVRNTPDCAGGQFATGFDAEGSVVCATPASPAAVVHAGAQSARVTIPSTNTDVQVVTLTVPAGTYALTAIGQVTGPLSDFVAACTLRASNATITSTLGHGHGFTHGSVAMFGLRTFTASTVLSVSCAAIKDGVAADDFGIQAVRVGS
jgi:hypothetical protein